MRRVYEITLIIFLLMHAFWNVAFASCALRTVTESQKDKQITKTLSKSTCPDSILHASERKFLQEVTKVLVTDNQLLIPDVINILRDYLALGRVWKQKKSPCVYKKETAGILHLEKVSPDQFAFQYHSLNSQVFLSGVQEKDVPTQLKINPIHAQTASAQAACPVLANVLDFKVLDPDRIAIACKNTCSIENMRSGESIVLETNTLFEMHHIYFTILPHDRLAGNDHEGNIIIWNCANGKIFYEFNPCQFFADTRNIMAMPNGDLLIHACHQNKHTRAVMLDVVHRIERWQQTRKIPITHACLLSTGNIFCVDFDDKPCDSRVYQRSSATGEIISKRKGILFDVKTVKTRGRVVRIQLLPEDRVALGLMNGSIEIINPHTLTIEETFKQEGAINLLTREGNTLISVAYLKGALIIWDLIRKSKRQKLILTMQRAQDFTLLSENRLVVSDDRGSIVVCEKEPCECITNFQKAS